jgi:hypothetical protein
MEREEWREKLSKAQTQEEFSELFDPIGAATGAEIRTEAGDFFIMEQKTIFSHFTSTTGTAKTKAG